MTIIGLLLAVAIVMISRVSQAKDSHDAWKVVQSFENEYLAYTTKNETLFECFSLVRQSISNSNKSAVFTAKFELGDSTQRVNLKALAMINGKPDTVDVVFTLMGVKQELHETILYTDYKTCYLSVFPRNSTICNLWATFNATKDDINTCLHRFELLCEAGVTNVYTKERCGVPN